MQQRTIRLLPPLLVLLCPALHAGRGRILTDQQVRNLPAPATPEGQLLVAVERASGVQPLALLVIAGQGDIPPEPVAKGASGG